MEQSYKEKYEQAIERLKQWDREHPCAGYVLSDRDKFIFPELAENKDERIWKMLIEFFGKGAKFNGSTNGISDKDIIAWLEKQGDYANFRDKAQVGDRITKNENGVLVNLSQMKRVARKNEKQGEQKSTDKVEPKFKVGDKIYLKPEYRMPSDDTPIANTVKEIIRIDDKHYRFDGSYIFIEDQDKYELVEQKPKENKGNIGGISPNSAWSEDDERLCQCLIEEQEKSLDAVRNCKYGHSEIISDLKEMYHERRDWLKSIKDRIQPKQEWSEEDSIRLQRIIDFLWYNRKGDTDTIYQQEQDIDWLKSLRPQNNWKPSELQLGCLSDAIEYYNSSGYPAPKLKELYEQLKKL